MSGIGREQSPVQPVPKLEVNAEVAVKQMLAQGTPEAFVSWMIDNNINLIKAYAAVQKYGWQAVAKTLDYNEHAASDQEQAAQPDRQAKKKSQANNSKLQSANQSIPSKPYVARHWLDEMIADTGLFILSAVFWVLNGLFTVIGVASVFPEGIWRIVGVIIGISLHLLISRIEVSYLTWRRIFSPYLFVIIFAILGDVGTSHQGLLLTIERFLPNLIAGVPVSTIEQVTILLKVVAAQLMQNPAVSEAETVMMPAWWFLTFSTGIFATVMALGSERAMRYFRRGMVATWRAKYGTQ